MSSRGTRARSDAGEVGPQGAPGERSPGAGPA